MIIFNRINAAGPVCLDDRAPAGTGIVVNTGQLYDTYCILLCYLVFVCDTQVPYRSYRLTCIGISSKGRENVKGSPAGSEPAAP